MHGIAGSLPGNRAPRLACVVTSDSAAQRAAGGCLGGCNAESSSASPRAGWEASMDPLLQPGLLRGPDGGRGPSRLGSSGRCVGGVIAGFAVSIAIDWLSG